MLKNLELQTCVCVVILEKTFFFKNFFFEVFLNFLFFYIFLQRDILLCKKHKKDIRLKNKFLQT
jgi:hypothetical protein